MKSILIASNILASIKCPILTFAITGIFTAFIISFIIFGSLIRETPPAALISAGILSKAITATAPAASAIFACSGVVTSIITPPASCFKISIIIPPKYPLAYLA